MRNHTSQENGQEFDQISLLQSFIVDDHRDLFTLDKDLRYVFFNERHIKGMKDFFDVDIAIGDCKPDLLPPEYSDQFRKLYSKALNGASFKHTQQFDKDYFTFQIAPILEGNETTGVSVQVYRATEKILYEQELEKHQEDLENLVIARAEEILDQRNFFQLIVDEDPNLIFVRNEEGEYVLVNKALAQLYHREVEEVVGHKMDSFEDLGDVTHYLNQDQDILSGRINNLSEEEKVHINGDERWYLVKKKCIIIGGEKYILGVQSDITHLKTTHTQLEKANYDLSNTLSDLRDMQFKLVSSEKIASMGLLTAGLIHEINNPINYVSGNVEPLKKDFEELKSIIEKSELLQEGTSEQSSYEFTVREISDLLEGIHEGASRVKNLTDNLRELSHSSSGKHEFCQVNKYLKATVKLISSTTGGRIVFEEDYNPKTKEIFVDPNQLNQIFLNILDLASLDLDKGQKVMVRTQMCGDNVIVDIINYGNFLDEKTLTRLIDPFDKGGGKKSIGLAISYKMITSLGGSFDNVPEETESNRFRLVFPAKII